MSELLILLICKNLNFFIFLTILFFLFLKFLNLDFLNLKIFVK